MSLKRKTESAVTTTAKMGSHKKFPHENKTNVKQLSTDCPVENEYGTVTEDANVLFVDVRTFIPPSSKILKY